MEVGMGPNATELATISGTVAVAIKMIQTARPGGIPPLTALITSLVVSFIALVLWTISQDTRIDVRWAFGLFNAWMLTASSGLGILVGASAIQSGQVNTVISNALRGVGSGAPPKVTTVTKPKSTRPSRKKAS